MACCAGCVYRWNDSFTENNEDIKRHTTKLRHASGYFLKHADGGIKLSILLSMYPKNRIGCVLLYNYGVIKKKRYNFGNQFGNQINNPDASVGVCCSHKVVAVGFNTLRYDASVGVLNPPHE